MRYPEWMERADCRGEDLELFFGHEGEHPAERKRREAVAADVCAACPVRSECLEFAVSSPEKYGYWAGTSEEDRRALHRNELRRARKLQVVA